MPHPDEYEYDVDYWCWQEGKEAQTLRLIDESPEKAALRFVRDLGLTSRLLVVFVRDIADNVYSIEIGVEEVITFVPYLLYKRREVLNDATPG